jgi:hypothetical protein
LSSGTRGHSVLTARDTRRYAMNVVHEDAHSTAVLTP